MTTFLTTDLPSSINSLEKLAVWASTVLNHLNTNQTAIEQTGNAQLTATSAPFYITASDPATWRNISRLSIPLDKNWQRGTGKIWTFAQDLSSSAIPTEFKS